MVDFAKTNNIPSQLLAGSPSQGDILYFNGTYWLALPKSVGKFLKSGDTPTWDVSIPGLDGSNYVEWAASFFRVYNGGVLAAALGEDTYVKIGGSLKKLTVDENGFVKCVGV